MRFHNYFEIGPAVGQKYYKTISENDSSHFFSKYLQPFRCFPPFHPFVVQHLRPSQGS